MALPFTAVGARTTASSTEAALVGASHMPAAVASETTTSDVAIAIAGLVSLRIVGRS
jgi:3-deoxy-D-arabino-heptulosonate 7-phosphate (DAHP) synthase